MFETLEMPLLWIGFLAFIACMIAIDLGVFHRKSHTVTFTEAISWSLVWFTLSMCFAGLVYFLPGLGPPAALNFVTGYLLELALSVDNMFVFIVIFGSFAVPASYQHRVLIWGILGAIILRGVFISLGAAIVEQFHWVLYIFGLILLYTGGRLLFAGEDDDDEASAGHAEGASAAEVAAPTGEGEASSPQPSEEKKSKIEQSRTVRFARWVLRDRITDRYHKEHFFVRENDKLYATPLLLVLFVIEMSDVLFALDSIPAIFGVTTNSFVVFTSNMFAILGLRNIYFVLQRLLPLFRFLKYGVALVLVFIALKILSHPFLHYVGWETFPTPISLGVVAVLLVGSVLMSWAIPEAKSAEPKKS